jgi:hypothetical protein
MREPQRGKRAVSGYDRSDRVVARFAADSFVGGALCPDGLSYRHRSGHKAPPTKSEGHQNILQEETEVTEKGTELKRGAREGRGDREI